MKAFPRFLLFASLFAALFAVAPVLAQLGDEEEVAPKSDARVRAALNEAGLKFEVDSDGDYRVILKYESSGRSQLVFINSDTEKFENMEIREVWSIGAESKSGFTRPQLESLLKLNNGYKMGSWRLTSNGQRAIFCVTASARANAESLKAIADLVARATDELEREWLGTDDY